MGAHLPNAEYLFCAPEYDYWANHEDLFGDAVFEDFRGAHRRRGPRQHG